MSISVIPHVPVAATPTTVGAAPTVPANKPASQPPIQKAAGTDSDGDNDGSGINVKA